MKALQIILPLSIVAGTTYSIHGYINAISFRINHADAAYRRRQILSMSTSYKSIYGVAQSGWKSPKWNWGSAIGTGHDCAKRCRQNYSNRNLRQELVSNLLNAQGTEVDLPNDFEEVKLTLALAWQRGRWDGSDGGKGGYSEVLHFLEIADRYENGPEIECSKLWIEDIASRFHLLQPSPDHASTMERLLDESRSSTGDEYNDTIIVSRGRRRCGGLVLHEMGFIENGC